MEVDLGIRSTLNPNAPLFIPAAYRQVKDDYRIKQHSEDESWGVYEDEDIVKLSSFDARLCDEIPSLEKQLEQAIQSATKEEKGMPLSGKQNVNAETLIKSLNLKSPRGEETKPWLEPLKYRGKPPSNHANPRRIQQPR